MKRFYKEVQVTSSPRRRPGSLDECTPASSDPGLRRGDAFDYGIALDTRPVRTPRKALLTVPTNALGEAIAEEWRAQDVEIKPETMRLSGLANAAIDLIAPDPKTYAKGLAVYAESDLLCYRADDPPELVSRQLSAWEPLLEWAQRRYDVTFTRVSGIMHKSQPPETLARLGTAITARGAFALAALSHIVTISGSLVIALAVLEREIAPDAAFDAAHLDELYQAEQWGEDWMAADARTLRRADFVSACRFLRLLNDD